MTDSSRCAIWNTIASSDGPVGRDGEYFNSSRAGGRYFISRRAQISLENPERYNDRFKARLTSWLVDQRRFGVRCPEIFPETLEEAEQFRSLTVHARADRLLRFVNSQTENIGDYCKFLSPLSTMAIAWSESIGISEVEYLIGYLREKGWIAEKPVNPLLMSYLVTVAGHARLADLDKTYTDSSQAFVAMWIDNSMRTAWGEGIEPGIRDAGYEPLRIDLKQHANKIDDEIIAEIRRSRFIVADFTHGEKGARGSVYYEAGFAQGLNIPVIFTCRKDMLDDIHFDTRQYPHIVWEQPEGLRQQLTKRVSAVIGDGPLR